ncbi:hypothetical protein LY76DRAFT_232680 [Colletotrichum caudatum]|nr:hypothetical protein LY76DRAFT_232680 [Colletotrichum caudatum]
MSKDTSSTRRDEQEIVPPSTGFAFPSTKLPAYEVPAANVSQEEFSPWFLTFLFRICRRLIGEVQTKDCGWSVSPRPGTNAGVIQPQHPMARLVSCHARCLLAPLRLDCPELGIRGLIVSWCVPGGARPIAPRCSLSTARSAGQGKVSPVLVLPSRCPMEQEVMMVYITNLEQREGSFCRVSLAQ